MNFIAIAVIRIILSATEIYSFCVYFHISHSHHNISASFVYAVYVHMPHGHIIYSFVCINTHVFAVENFQTQLLHDGLILIIFW